LECTNKYTHVEIAAPEGGLTVGGFKYYLGRFSDNGVFSVSLLTRLRLRASKLDSYFQIEKRELSESKDSPTTLVCSFFPFVLFVPSTLPLLHFGSLYSPIHLDTLLRITTTSYDSINLRSLYSIQSIIPYLRPAECYNSA